MNKSILLDINQIKKLLPHRYPFLLVDKVIDFVKDDHIMALKNVTINEEFFQGHFPVKPIMPGVLIIEALAQTATLYFLLNMGAEENHHTVYFMSLDKCKFRKPVEPGDQLYLKIIPQIIKGKMCKMEAKAYVEDKVVCEGILTAMMGK